MAVSHMKLPNVFALLHFGKGFVSIRGLEPLRLAAQNPKSCASANSAISRYFLLGKGAHQET